MPKLLSSQGDYLERQDLFGYRSSDMFVRNKKPQCLILMLDISPGRVRRLQELRLTGIKQNKDHFT